MTGKSHEAIRNWLKPKKVDSKLTVGPEDEPDEFIDDCQQAHTARLLRSAADGIELTLLGLDRETDADIDQAVQCLVSGACELRVVARRLEGDE